MIKHFKGIFLAPLFAALSAVPSYAQETFNISGTIAGGKGRMIYFSSDVYKPNVEKVKLDSASIDNLDHFELSGKLKYPGQYSLFLGDQKSFLDLYVDGTKIRVKADANAIYRGSVEGSKDQALIYSFYATDGPIQEKLSQNLALAQKAKKSLDTPHVVILSQKIDSLNRVRQVHLNAFAQQNPTAYQTLLNLDNFMGNLIDYDTAAAYLKGFAGKYHANPLFHKLNTLLAGRKTAVQGAILPDVVLQDISGKHMLDSKDLRAANDYVLIDFWASWCAPCRANTPLLQELYAKYKSRKFEILGVSFDTPAGGAAWRKAVKDDKTNWPQVSDLKGFDSKYALQFNVQSLPTYMLIDKNGKLILNTNKISDVKSKLATLYE